MHDFAFMQAKISKEETFQFLRREREGKIQWSAQLERVHIIHFLYQIFGLTGNSTKL